MYILFLNLCAEISSANFAGTKKVSTFATYLIFNLLNKESMSNQYETVFIVTPVLSEAQMKEAVLKFRTLITDEGGTVVHEEDWGLRKLAYPIQKKSTGFYYLIEYTSNPEFIDKLETEYRRDERIIRFITLRMDKYSVEYSEKKRHRQTEKKQED